MAALTDTHKTSKSTRSKNDIFRLLPVDSHTVFDFLELGLLEGKERDERKQSLKEEGNERRRNKWMRTHQSVIRHP